MIVSGLKMQGGQRIHVDKLIFVHIEEKEDWDCHL